MRIERHPVTDRESWLQMRRQDVTASDVGAVFGLHPYRTPLALWTEKTTPLAPDAENAAMRRGRWLEDAVVAACREHHPDWTLTKPGLYLRATDERIGATPDAIASTPDGEVLVQCKTVAEPIFKAAWQDGPPAYYQLQALTEAMLWGAPSAIVAVLIVSAFGADYREYPVPRHEAAERKIVDGVAGFWRSIAAGETPKADYTADADLLAKLYAPDAAAPPLDLSADNYLPELLAERETLMAEVKDKESRIDAIKAEIVEKLHGAPAATLPGWTITHRMQSRKETVLKATTFPVLRISRAKEKAA